MQEESALRQDYVLAMLLIILLPSSLLLRGARSASGRADLPACLGGTL